MVSLVTGGHGFLGAYIQAALAHRGEVVAAGRPDMEIPSAEFDACFTRSQTRIGGALRRPRLGGGVSGRSWLRLRGERRRDVRAPRPASLSPPRRPRVVFVSSAAVYGNPPSLPVDEKATPCPMSPYGRHKVECEQLLREFHERIELPSVSLRVFSAYGEGLRRQIFWDVCVQALANGEIRLHGSGSETRDFVHAYDVAKR